MAYAGSRLGKDGVTRSKEEAARWAAEAAAKLRSGAEFSEVMAEYGDNPGNGELGRCGGTRLRRIWRNPIFSLGTGEISDPVETPWGFHVFEVTARKIPTFEELEAQLSAQAQQLWTRVAVENLREGAAVELDETFFSEAQ